MKSIILNEPGDFVRATCDDPGDPASGMARIAIDKIGICGTDLHAFRGRQPFFEYPRILGHELAWSSNLSRQMSRMFGRVTAAPSSRI